MPLFHHESYTKEHGGKCPLNKGRQREFGLKKSLESVPKATKNLLKIDTYCYLCIWWRLKIRLKYVIRNGWPNHKLQKCIFSFYWLKVAKQRLFLKFHFLHLKLWYHFLLIATLMFRCFFKQKSFLARWHYKNAELWCLVPIH